MTSTQPDLEPEIPAVKVQRMKFPPGEVDEHKAVYRAVIDDGAAPGAPIWALTVTVARELFEAEELKSFISEIDAGFVLTAPNTEDIADDREPAPDLDLAQEILIEPELVRLRALDGTFGFTAVVRTAVAEADDSPPHRLRSAPVPEPVVARAYLLKRDRVLAGRDHRYTARGGVPTATATARAGSGTIRRQLALNPAQTITVGGGSRSARGTAVWVRGGVRACTYDFVGNFNGP